MVLENICMAFDLLITLYLHHSTWSNLADKELVTAITTESIYEQRKVKLDWMGQNACAFIYGEKSPKTKFSSFLAMCFFF